MHIVVEDEDRSPYREPIRGWAERVLVLEELPDATELGLLLAGRGRTRELNREHRGIDSATDVLSFPMYEDKEDALAEAKTLSEGQPLLIGDVVICVDVAADNAREDGRPVEDELRLLVVHGLLHLLGYDHEGSSPSERERAARMRARERELVGELARAAQVWGGEGGGP